MKLAFSVQRYGTRINGGAELHCRLLAERFAAQGNEVHVYTTCAHDYMTWTDVYEPGVAKLNGVHVHWFRVDAPRDIARFNAISEEVYSTPTPIQRQEEWMRAQGPYATELFKAIGTDKDKYDWILFYNYLYCTTYFGLPLCSKKAILAPMAHDEPPIYLEIFKKIFTGCCALMYNTEEERDFVETQFDVAGVPSRVVGMWAPEPLEESVGDAFLKKAGSGHFIVYIGRVDASKGCGDLIRHFIRYKEAYPSDVKLLLMGTGDMEVPRHADVVEWGYASDSEKWQALRGAIASVIPSMYESLSISLLESFVVKRPVIVNGNCSVTYAHCTKSNGGLWYRNFDEFAQALEFLRCNPARAAAMGKNGEQYVEYNYGWDGVMNKYSSVFAELDAGEK